MPGLQRGDQVVGHHDRTTRDVDQQRALASSGTGTPRPPARASRSCRARSGSPRRPAAAGPGRSAIACTPSRAVRATRSTSTSNGSSLASMSRPMSPYPTISTVLSASDVPPALVPRLCVLVATNPGCRAATRASGSAPAPPSTRCGCRGRCRAARPSGTSLRMWSTPAVSVCTTFEPRHPARSTWPVLRLRGRTPGRRTRTSSAESGIVAGSRHAPSRTAARRAPPPAPRRRTGSTPAVARQPCGPT